MPVSTLIFFRISRRLVVALSLLGCLFAAPVQAQTYPHPISLQGLLLDANGDPLSGNYDLTFRIYDAANGGTSLWEETHQNVLVSEGLYGVALGLSPNLPPDLFIGLPRHLEVSVNGEVLAPRIELRAVPLAYAAKTLTDGALQAGSNVSITRQADGILRIDANGGGGGGGLSSVATDATLEGDGTSGNPLGLDDDAVQAGTNVTVTRNNDGAFVVSSTGGGGGGLSAVASDATLVGNGTGANPMGLADGAVTGAKMADGALVAGSNVTITRQGDGAFRIGAAGGGSGFSLPFAGSTSSGGAAFSVSNTGSGDGINISAGRMGIRVTQAGEHGLHIDQANNGVNIVAAAGAGMAVGSTGNFGVYINSAGQDGFRVNSAGRNGVAIGTASQTGVSVFQANAHGMSITTANGNGVEVGSAGVDGIQIQSAGRDGLRISSAEHGVHIQNAASRGVQIDQASIGMFVGSTSSNGIQVSQAGVDGIQIQSAGRDGIRIAGAAGYGILATGATGAGFFGGDVEISGTLSKGGGSFKIDHPLDPANKYLAHSFVESPDMMNVYNGNAVLDAAGEAIVTLPDYFETLNRDFRYQLTCIGGFAPVYIAEKISGNQFRIAGGQAGMEVSWQVTGIRQDAWANENRIVVEQDKMPEERGFYLYPKLYSQPETRNLIHVENDF